jgi:hypothetical protein
VVLNTPNRDDGLIQMWIDSVVTKEFRHADAVERVNKLVEIYQLLKLKGVPNVDTVDQYNTTHSSPYVELSPVGIDTTPDSGSGVFDAVRCALQALKVCYDISIFII